MSSADYRLEDQIGFLIRKASQRHAAIFAAHMTEDLTPTQWAALVKIAAARQISQNLLGRETAMDAATIKGVVDRLLARGLVAVTPDPHDGRRNLIAVTEPGEAILERGYPKAATITAETFASLDAGEQATLTGLLRRIS